METAKTKILDLFYGGMNDREQIAEIVGVTKQYVDDVIRMDIVDRDVEYHKAVRAVHKKPEVGMPILCDDGRTRYDYTDLWLDRPCIY